MRTPDTLSTTNIKAFLNNFKIQCQPISIWRVTWRFIFNIRILVMMMITFITIKSSLLPLIEGLCAPILFGISFFPFSYIYIYTGVVDEIDHKIILIFNRPSTIDRNSQ